MKKILIAALPLVMMVLWLRANRPAGTEPPEPSGSLAAEEHSVATEAVSSKKPAEGALPAASGSDCSLAEVELILQRHNQARAAVGARPLTWSPDLAGYAQAWAEHLAAAGCSFEHRPGSGPWQQKHGENLFTGTAGYYGAGEAVDSWINEKQFYQGQPLDESNYHQFGHYTQAVWKTTKQIGCGKALCNGQVIIVCNYAPAGNVLGEKAW